MSSNPKVLFTRHWWKVLYRRWQGRKPKRLRREMRKTAKTVIEFTQETTE